MRRDMIGSYIIIAIAGLTIAPVAAGSQFVRELDAYCVSSDGAREGVAASQDGATNFYVQRPGEEDVITRSVHSRRMVSLWHAELDAAGFERMAETRLDAPYCAVNRMQAGQVHEVQWREGAVPAALADIFAAMLAVQTRSQEVGQ